jgi:hypothetical protein
MVEKKSSHHNVRHWTSSSEYYRDQSRLPAVSFSTCNKQSVIPMINADVDVIKAAIRRNDFASSTVEARILFPKIRMHMNTKHPNVISDLGVTLTDSVSVYTVYTVNTIQYWVEMHGFVVTVRIGLLSCLQRNNNRLLTLFSKRLYENLSDLELSLARHYWKSCL